MEERKVDVLIPSYKPKEEFLKLIHLLENQTYPVNRIIIINTEEKYISNLFYGQAFEKEHIKVSVSHISKREFDHAKVRRDLIQKSDAEFFIFMTDDALPEDETLVEKLLAPIISGKAQASYARQLPRERCNLVEAYARHFNYPSAARVQSKETEEKYGIKNYFFSNVCAAYDRKTYDKLGGFVDYAIFNEDMLYAYKLIQSGGKIAYVPKAHVFHSHNYTNKEYFKRNFDIGVSHAEHPEVFEKLPASSEGRKLVKKTAAFLWKKGHWYKIPGLIVTSAYKYLGYRYGKRYEKLSERRIMKYSMNPEYWIKKNIRTATKNINPYSGYGMSPDERR